MIRKCKDLGLWALDRSVTSCVHRTAECERTCYNRKLYKLYPAMAGRDKWNDIYWNEVTPEEFAHTLRRRRVPIKRFRFATRGEMLSDAANLHKVAAVCAACPEITFWLPTRAWRNAELRALCEAVLMPIKNLRLQASLDISNTRAEYESLRDSGWSTMFYGNDEQPIADTPVKCVKTWTKAKSVCVTCKTGCFRKGRTDVWLKKH
jgi:hypothetical protein